jgi:hypothetical protein
MGFTIPTHKNSLALKLWRREEEEEEEEEEGGEVGGAHV